MRAVPTSSKGASKRNVSLTINEHYRTSNYRFTNQINSVERLRAVYDHLKNINRNNFNVDFLKKSFHFCNMPRQTTYFGELSYGRTDERIFSKIFNQLRIFIRFLFAKNYKMESIIRQLSRALKFCVFLLICGMLRVRHIWHSHVTTRFREHLHFYSVCPEKTFQILN